MSSAYYITTAIPYVNAKPHIGFALELVQADVMARRHRLNGDETYFLTGSDDNALKNVQAAEKVGMTTAQFVDKNAAIFQDLAKKLNISNDQFVRTATREHFAGAQKLWSSCKPEDIYKKKYKGLYCVGCEQFYTEKELEEGKCPEHKTALEEVEEENYFFKLTSYQQELEELIESDAYKVTPDFRKNEVLSFIRMGLEDFSISRSVARAKGWGVPVPGDDSQIMYVWFDALSNYITALGYQHDDALFKKFWPADVHAIGKGIIRFHAVYWPAMLLSAGIQLPRELFVHGYINVGGEKMSKSLGNVVDPIKLIDEFGSEAVRLYLLRHVHPVQDSDYSRERFVEAYNADLANGLGNLLSRTTNMIERSLNGKLPKKLNRYEPFLQEVDDELSAWNFRAATNAIWDKLTWCDQLIDKEKPWELGDNDPEKLRDVLDQVVQVLFNVAIAIRPILPQTAEIVEQSLIAEPIVKAKPLFGKIEL